MIMDERLKEHIVNAKKATHKFPKRDDPEVMGEDEVLDQSYYELVNQQDELDAVNYLVDHSKNNGLPKKMIMYKEGVS